MTKFRIGGSEIETGKIKVGDSDVSKIYQGSTQVWPSIITNCGAGTVIIGDQCWTTENETSTTTQGSTFTLSTSGVSSGQPNVSYKEWYGSGSNLVTTVTYTDFDHSSVSANYTGSGCLIKGQKYKITFTDGTTTFDGVWEWEGHYSHTRKGAFTTARPSSYYECVLSSTNSLNNDNQYWIISLIDADLNDRTTEMQETYECADVSCNTSNPNYNGNQWTVTIGDLNDTSYSYSTSESITMATTNQQLKDYIDDGVPAACWWNFDSNNSYRGLYYNAYAARILQPPSSDYRMPTSNDWSDLLSEVNVVSPSFTSSECTALITDDQNSGWPSLWYDGYSWAASSGFDTYPYEWVNADASNPFSQYNYSASFWRKEATQPFAASASFESTISIYRTSHQNGAQMGSQGNNYKYANVRWIKDV